MPVDIYLRVPNDPNYDETQYEVDDKIFNFIQGIEMILTTDKGEVLGVPDMGANLEAYLWNSNVSVSTIKSEINRQILEYCPDASNEIPYSIDINFFNGDIVDTMLVDIYINDEKVLGIAATPSNKNENNSTK